MKRRILLIFLAASALPLTQAAGQSANELESSHPGAKIYAKGCAACHSTGVAGAPQLAHTAAWFTRLAKPKKKLYQHAISGIGAMPPKGGNPTLTDKQVKQAVDFMIAVVKSKPPPQPGLAMPSDADLLAVPTSKLQINAEPGKAVKNPLASDPAAIGRGKSLFASMHCVGCHAPGGGGGIGPALSDDVWIYGNNPADIYLTLAHGRPGGMPAFGGLLPPQAIWSLVAFVKTLNDK